MPTAAAITITMEYPSAISEVRRQLGNRVFPALGLTVGFNSMDGD